MDGLPTVQPNCFKVTLESTEHNGPEPNATFKCRAGFDSVKETICTKVRLNAANLLTATMLTW